MSRIKEQETSVEATIPAYLSADYQVIVNLAEIAFQTGSVKSSKAADEVRRVQSIALSQLQANGK